MCTTPISTPINNDEQAVMSNPSEQNVANEVPSKNNSSASTLQSAELLLSIIQEEYKYEDDRNKGFQNRAGIFISLTGVILSLLFTKIDTSKLTNINVSKLSDAILPFIYIVLLFIIFIGLISSLIYFVSILATKQYSRLSLKGFDDQGLALSRETIAANIMKSYASIVKENGFINDKKAKHIKRGYITLTISIILIPILLLIDSLL